MEYLLSILAMGITYKIFSYKNKSTVPWVKGCYPFIGHGLNIGKDIKSFLNKCKQ